MDGKDRFIQELAGAIREEFGRDAFSIVPTNEANSILLEKVLDDEKVTFSILSTKSSEKTYSIQVTGEGEKYKRCLVAFDDVALYTNIDILADKYADKDEVIAILKRYQ